MQLSNNAETWDCYYCYQAEAGAGGWGSCGITGPGPERRPCQPGLSHHTRFSQLPAHSQPGNALISVLSLSTEVRITMG